jgi:hypothetical protein
LDTEFRFSCDGVEYAADIARMTFAEGRAVEKVTGVAFVSVMQLYEQGRLPLSMIQALIWVTMKRKEPELRFVELDDRAIADFEFPDAPEAAAGEDGEPAGSPAGDGPGNADGGPAASTTTPTRTRQSSPKRSGSARGNSTS